MRSDFYSPRVLVAVEPLVKMRSQTIELLWIQVCDNRIRIDGSHIEINQVNISSNQKNFILFVCSTFHIRRHVKHFEGLVPCQNLVHVWCKENWHRTYESRVKEDVRAMKREHLGKWEGRSSKKQNIWSAGWTEWGEYVIVQWSDGEGYSGHNLNFVLNAHFVHNLFRICTRLMYSRQD